MAASSYADLLQQVVQPVVLLGDAGGAVAAPDAPWFSLYGDSWAWNRWLVDGFDISDPLTPGAYVLNVPAAAVATLAVAAREAEGAWARNYIALELDQDLTGPRRRVVGTAYGIGSLGGKVPWAEPVMDAISGQHSDNRVLPPHPERRRLQHPLHMWAVDGARGRLVQVRTALELRLGRRRFPAFAPLTAATQLRPDATGSVAEDYRLASALLTLLPHRSEARWLLGVAVANREHAGIELFQTAAESPQRHSEAAVAGFAWRGLHTNVVFKHHRDRYSDRNFAREWRDPDGQRLLPFAADGDTWALAHRLDWHEGPLWARLDQTVIAGRPKTKAWTHAWTDAGTPFARWDLSADDYTHLAGDNRLGVATALVLGGARLAANAYLAQAWGKALGAEPNYLIADVGLWARLGRRQPKNSDPFLVLAKSPLAPGPGDLAALDRRVLYGRAVLYDGRPHGSIGGGRVDPELRMADIYSLGVGWQRRLGEVWVLTLSGVAKAYHQTYRLRLDGSPNTYGFTQGRAFFASASEIDYLLTNRSTSPIYGGAHISLVGRRHERYTVQAALSAYNVIGRSGAGNGPTANDLSNLGFAAADPNSDGDKANLDADRAFNTRITYGQRLVQQLWLWTTLAHFDGTPFAAYDFREWNGYRARPFANERGAPFDYRKPLAGTREDFRLIVDTQLRWTHQGRRADVTLFAVLVNAFDMANEIVEAQNEWPTKRVALEQQPPRSLWLGIEISDFGLQSPAAGS